MADASCSASCSAATGAAAEGMPIERVTSADLDQVLRTSSLTDLGSVTDLLPLRSSGPFSNSSGDLDATLASIGAASGLSMQRCKSELKAQNLSEISIGGL